VEQWPQRAQEMDLLGMISRRMRMQLRTIFFTWKWRLSRSHTCDKVLQLQTKATHIWPLLTLCYPHFWGRKCLWKAGTEISRWKNLPNEGLWTGSTLLLVIYIVTHSKHHAICTICFVISRLAMGKLFVGQRYCWVIGGQR
jgi:hypothetical protein